MPTPNQNWLARVGGEVYSKTLAFLKTKLLQRLKPFVIALQLRKNWRKPVQQKKESLLVHWSNAGKETGYPTRTSLLKYVTNPF